MTRPSVSRLSVRPDLLAALAVALAPVLYFLPAVRGEVILCPDDGLLFNVPLRVAAAQITLDGSAPLWNPYIFGGMPLLASAQGGLLFPLNWFYLAFTPTVATNLMVISSYVVAALGAYLYARRSGSNIAGAVVTSIVWQWGGFLVAQVSHINIVQTAAMLPWILWAADGYGTGRGRKWGVLLAVLVALQSFVGHQQTFAYSLMLASVYAVVMAFAGGRRRALYLWSLAFLAAGVLLSAVQILPTFELLRNSPRAAASYEFFTSFSMPRRFLMSFFAPYVMGGGDGRLFRAAYVGPAFYAEYVAYVGLLTAMLALFAVACRRDAQTKFWAAVAVVCLVLALGHKAPLGLYKLIYHVPVLNLFRVPARHLMEVEFALAVLAGRGLTALRAARGQRRALRLAGAAGALVFLLTCLVVTLGRPADFKLGREAPVSLMRAPELFVPVFVAALSAWALWTYARGRRQRAGLLVVAVLALDLAAWGQFTGWRVSGPKPDEEYWQTPETVKLLRGFEQKDPTPYRILTAPHSFDPAFAPVGPSVSRSTDWVLWTQPDVYMMHNVENAAGYDGFGFARYGRLAGGMTVWGELSDPDATLRGPSREMDLLNVRYLLSMRRKGGPIVSAPAAANPVGPQPAAASSGAPTPAAAPSSVAASGAFPPSPQDFGGYKFAATDLGLSTMGGGKRLSFSVPPVEAERVALVTNLSWSEDVPDGTTIGRVRLRAGDGRVFDFALRAGADTAEWAYDRADISARIRHKRAVVATSYTVEDAQGKYEGHTYVTSFALPEKMTIAGGEIVVEKNARWPDLLLGVFRVSLVGSEGNAFPLRREWLAEATPAPSEAAHADASKQAQPTTKPQQQQTASKKQQSPPTGNRQGAAAGGEANGDKSVGRWRLLAQTSYVDFYENARALPRAWLATGAIVLGEEPMLEVIRTGRLPDGEAWEPRRTALVEAPIDFKQTVAGDADARAEVTGREPNRVEVKAAAGAPSILVLGENHYPGWRAYVDGHAAETLRVDYNLRGVVLPAGEHTVEFAYRPKSVLAGLVLSLLTLAALLVWASRGGRDRTDAGIIRDE